MQGERVLLNGPGGKVSAQPKPRQQPRVISFDKGVLLLYNYGDEDQNDLMELIDKHKGDEATMETTKIQDLVKEVEIYKQAIQDAKDALASAEMELDETLDAEFNQ